MKTLREKKIMKKMMVERMGQNCKVCIVKRAGHTEEFDERKVYASCYASCLNAHIPKEKAEQICEKVCTTMKKWAVKKKKISSHQIFKQVIATIKKHSKDAAFMYETHRDVS